MPSPCYPPKVSNHCRLLAMALVLMLPFSVAAAEAPPAGGDDAQTLAKKLSNPVADMVSVPFQFNWVNGIGP